MTSLYVHVPFCVKKCSYCAFYSVPYTVPIIADSRISGGADRADHRLLSDPASDLVSVYLCGLERELELRAKEASQGVSSLFIGGGTPTVLDVTQLERLLSLICRYYFKAPNRTDSTDISDPLRNPLIHTSWTGQVIEKTIECNPGTLDREKLMLCRTYGINRISLGAQSFNDRLLKSIDRIHTAEDIHRSVALVRQSGIDNLNLDLIFGLPGQKMGHWQDTLRQAITLSPEHLSLYALTLEEDTPLHKEYACSQAGSSDCKETLDDSNSRRRLNRLPDDDLQADMYEWAVSYLQSFGYGRYEVSNFARPGFECKHNQSYWRGQDYIGLGPGAVSCLHNARTRNREDIAGYARILESGLRPLDPSANEVLTREQKISEFMMLGLRMADGIDIAEFAAKFQTEIQDIYGRILQNYIDKDIFLLAEGRLKINPACFFVLNAVLVDFML
ncbi:MULTISPECIES: radical SAM family heme chaperone HemW [unclassified Dehalobacter]|uniref:radical SAM family heme chaperone HemW n=1 Tax=unclassified Dehalobacter TaxID=2635733 RepID=UPI000E6CE103|nr:MULTISPECIES: radical SAM family heme chaperone HemW [unclassified Dehalobacter]RJE47113.1 coproporphyrinogen III oxidase [Dehalobacter sp. MCB1]TCX53725.1 coproporphyrinogen III oxidase [Dehalobacter sp. 14DCB1]TCX55028.1 coproporphyrinogen III oxidase [Dehalobacter sp. 12DCB1]